MAGSFAVLLWLSEGLMSLGPMEWWLHSMRAVSLSLLNSLLAGAAQAWSG